MVILLIVLLGRAAFSEPVNWTDRFQVNGDFRFRHEYTSKSKFLDTAYRHQERFRLRVGAEALVNENIKAKIRIGGSDGQSPISNNTTMTDNANKKGLYIDLAAIEWKLCPGSTLNLGKQENPLRTLALSQLIYDADYTPEGASVVSKMAGMPFYFSAAAYTLQERAVSSTTTTSEPDSWLKAITVGYKKELSRNWSYHVGAGYHDFSNVYNKSALSPGFAGNSNAGAKYLNDYSVGEIFGEVRLVTHNRVYSAYADGADNLTIGKNNQGLQTGVQVQILNDDAKADWTFGYSYLTLGKDTTVSAINNSDSASGIDGGISHIFQAGGRIGENVSFNLTYFHAKVDNSGQPFWTEKGLADLMFAF